MGVLVWGRGAKFEAQAIASAASNPEVAVVSDLCLTHKDIHETRLIRDAEGSN